MEKQRSEEDIFSDLAVLVKGEGYIYAIAYSYLEMILDDNSQTLGNESPSRTPKTSSEIFIRNELLILLGLLFRERKVTKKEEDITDLDFTMPSVPTLEGYITQTKQYLQELHNIMQYKSYSPMLKSLGLLKDTIDIPQKKEKETEKRDMQFREGIFFGPDSAGYFQYFDFAFKKYHPNDEYFQTKKGYSLAQARKILSNLESCGKNKLHLYFKRYNRHYNKYKRYQRKLMPFEELQPSPLDAFTFCYDEIAEKSGCTISVVKAFINSFTARGTNKRYQSVDGFNTTKAYPIFKINDHQFLLFDFYMLCEAFYETPFYWLNNDKAYEISAAKYRGQFTEDVIFDRLERVFGEGKVFKNVIISKSKKEQLSEIDVLVLYANTIIIVQAKSQRLTIPARQGYKTVLDNNFENAIQHAYNQGLKCAEFIQQSQKNNVLIKDNKDIKWPSQIKDIYILCAVSDHYPALFNQTKKFLKYEVFENINRPYVIDIFQLDVLTEFLDNPLYFIDYLKKRLLYDDRLITTIEHDLLAYHLRYNLYLNNNIKYLALDNMAIDLNVAMMARRVSMNESLGSKTPNGILTHYKGTSVGRLLEHIKRAESPDMIEFGIFLLSLNNKDMYEINKGIANLLKSFQKDGQPYHFAMTVDTPHSGLGIHIMQDKCLERINHIGSIDKYGAKANIWYSLCISPHEEIHFVLNLTSRWEQSDKMDSLLTQVTNRNYNAT